MGLIQTEERTAEEDTTWLTLMKMADRPTEERPELKPTYRVQLVWPNVIGFLVLHSLAAYGVWLSLSCTRFYTTIYTAVLLIAGSEGIKVGAHRYWSHKSFKARTPLRLLLVFLQTMGSQNCVYIWARDHRMHHKYSDTDADPHNSKRGFFFSHMGWLMVRKHPEVIAKGRTIDMSDLDADQIVQFQKKYYYPLYITFRVVLATLVPWLCWGEGLLNSFLVTYLMAVALQLNGTWLVNSWAHMFGTHPYTAGIPAVESQFVGHLAMGEGWHNYHHSFPWDYRASEWGRFNLSGDIIDLFAKIGWAYDRRKATPAMVNHRVMKRGDGSYRGPAGTISEEVPSVPDDDIFAESLVHLTTS